MKLRINLDAICLALFVGSVVYCAVNENLWGVCGYAAATFMHVTCVKAANHLRRAYHINQLLGAFYNAHKGQLPPDIPKEQVDKFKQLMGEV